MLSHREKSVKTLIDERLEGKKYARVYHPKPVINLSQISLQLIAPINPVLKSFLDDKTEVCTSTERTVETRDEIMGAMPVAAAIEPEIKVKTKAIKQPKSKRKLQGSYSLPTQLQKLGSASGITNSKIKKAKSLQGFEELTEDLQIKSSEEKIAQVTFSRMPKTLANLVR